MLVGESLRSSTFLFECMSLHYLRRPAVLNPSTDEHGCSIILYQLWIGFFLSEDLTSASSIIPLFKT